MDTLVILVSEAALRSGWVALELKSAIKREIDEKRVMVLPFIIDNTSRDHLPWFLVHRNVPRITRDQAGADEIVKAVKHTIERRSEGVTSSSKESDFKREPTIERVLANVTLGAWNAAENAARVMLSSTDETGQNEVFAMLLRYLDCPDNDLRDRAIMVIESFAQLAPWLIDRKLLILMANHRDFMIRSCAAVICFDLAQFAPEHVPVDVLVRLAVHNEDWYVSSPATAALKTMARSRPAIIRMFLAGLREPDASAREHAARAIADIAEKEPEVLEREELERELSMLAQIHDESARDNIAEAISKVEKSKTRGEYKYGPF
jgi:HEAT repeat protein